MSNLAILALSLTGTLLDVPTIKRLAEPPNITDSNCLIIWIVPFSTIAITSFNVKQPCASLSLYLKRTLVYRLVIVVNLQNSWAYA